MPRVPDKIIINCNTLDGLYYAIMKEMESARMLSEEITSLGAAVLKADADVHLKDQEDACAEIDKALTKFLTGQQARNDTRRKWLDTQLP